MLTLVPKGMPGSRKISSWTRERNPETAAEPHLELHARRPISVVAARSGSRPGLPAVKPRSSSRVGSLKVRPQDAKAASSSRIFQVAPA